MKRIIVSPSILSCDFSHLANEIKRLEVNNADWIHIDVMDGHFVPNITFGSCIVKSIKKITNLPLDVHLMITNPLEYIEDFAKAGADIITFHVEAQQDKTQNIIDKIHSLGIKAGISIKPKTPIAQILKFVDKVDLILVMTVEPGFGGQKFMSECAYKIKELSTIVKENVIIEVDGGINDKTGKYCIEQGAKALVAGNYVFTADDMQCAINSLR